MIAPAHGFWPRRARSSWRGEGSDVAPDSNSARPIDQAVTLLDRALDLTRRSATCFALGESEDGLTLLEARHSLLKRIGVLLVESGEEQPVWTRQRGDDETGAVLAGELERIGTVAAELGRLDAEIERLREGRPLSEW